MIIRMGKGDVASPAKQAGLFTADLEAFNDRCAHTKYERKWRIRPSEVGYCLRKTVMSILNICPPDIPKPRIQRIFDNGSAVHKRYLNEYLPNLDNFYPAKVYYYEQGEVWCTPFIEEKVAVPDYWLRGAPDAVLAHRTTGHLYVFELKSIKQDDFNALLTPLPEHVVQAYLYMFMTHTRHAILFYEAKDTQLTKEFCFERDETVMSQILERVRSIQTFVKEYATTKALPQKCNHKYCITCK